MIHTCTYTYNGTLLSHKKEQNNTICSNTDASRDDHTKYNTSQRQIPYDITSMWSLKYGTNCHWNALAMRSCCVALGTMSSHL